MIYYAEHTQDEKMLAAVEKEFEHELSNFITE